MTLGSAPEALVLGYLRNQRLVESPDDIESHSGGLGDRFSSRENPPKHGGY